MAYSGSTWYTPEEHLKFTVNSNVTVTVVSGDITLMKADAVVVGDDNYLTGVGAVARAFSRIGGHVYTKAKDDMRTKHAPIRGTASAKPVHWCDAGPSLSYKRVYHAILPQVHGPYVKDQWQRGIAALYTSVCAEADTKNQETSIVVPVLGSGGGGGDFADTVWAALNGIRAFHAIHLKDVLLVERDGEKAKKIVSVCQGWIRRQKQKLQNLHCNILPAGSASGGLQGSSGTRHTRSSSPSGGLLGSDRGQSGSQSNSWSSTSSSRPRHQPGSYREKSPGRSGHGGGSGDFKRERSPSSRYSESTATASSPRWREPEQQEIKRGPEYGKPNYHMENVLHKRREGIREPGGERRRYHTTATFPEKARGLGSQGSTASHHEDRHGGRRSHDRTDDRDITPMEVDDTEPSRTSYRKPSMPDPQEKNKPSLTGPHIVRMDNIEDESSDDETSPHPGSDGNTPPKRKETGTPSHLSNNGNLLPPSSRADPDRGLSSENQGGRAPRNAYIQNEDAFRSTFGASDARFHSGDKEDYKSPIPSHSSGSRRNISGRYGTTGSQSSPLYSSSGKAEGSQFSTHDNGFSSLGSTSQSSTSTRYAGGGNDRSFQRSYSNEDKLHQSSSGCVVRGASATSKVSRQNSGGENAEMEMATARNRSSGIDAWENIEQRTDSSPEGKMVVTQNKRIQLDGCDVLVIEYSFPNGVQGSGHSVPGQPYTGTFRRAFLPDSSEGREVLALLRKAFQQNLLFFIRNDSDECLVDSNSNIPHLTSHRDSRPNVKAYLRNVKSVLKEKYRLDLE